MKYFSDFYMGYWREILVETKRRVLNYPAPTLNADMRSNAASEHGFKLERDYERLPEILAGQRYPASSF